LFRKTKVSNKDIYYSYKILLNREPDKLGFENFKKLVRSQPDMNLTQLVQYFMDSIEFQNYYSSLNKSNKEFAEVKTIHEFSIYVDKEDYAVGKQIQEIKNYEPDISNLFKSYLKEDSCFIDIGANIGFYSLLTASISKKGKIFSFEPNTFNCLLLEKSKLKNQFQNIQINPLACSDSDKFFFLDSSGSNGYVTDIYNSEKISSTRKITKAVCLDDFLFHIPRLDIMKIDIEGGEYRAFKGSENLIKKFKPILFFEYTPDALKTVSGVEPSLFLNELMKLGYKLNWIQQNKPIYFTNPEELKEELNKRQHLDILAIHSTI
jgi:FkbM family methyltransferase